MALVVGTNCGFVTEAPTSDPDGSGSTGMDGYSRAFKDVSPSGAVKITEIGWYCTQTTEEANFEVGIYTHNVGDDNPEAVVGSLYQTNAKGTGAGWKTVTVDISITAGTTYWIAVQLDAHSGATYIDVESDATPERVDYKTSQTTLTSPWGVSGYQVDWILPFYAVWEAAAVGTNMKINIGDVWKDVESMKINIGDAWKDVAEVKQNIGDAWKVVY